MHIKAFSGQALLRPTWGVPDPIATVMGRWREGRIHNFTTAPPGMLTILMKTIVNTNNNTLTINYCQY